MRDGCGEEVIQEQEPSSVCTSAQHDSPSHRQTVSNKNLPGVQSGVVAPSAGCHPLLSKQKKRNPSLCKPRLLLCMNHTGADTSLIVPVTSSYHGCQVKRWNHHIRGGGEDIFWYYLMNSERFFSKQQQLGFLQHSLPHLGENAGSFHRTCNSWLVDLFVIWIGFKKIH